MVRLALVGYGAWGRNYLQAAHDAGNCEVVCIVTSYRLQGDSRSERARQSGLPVHQSLYDAKEKSKVDAVVYAGHPKYSPAWAVHAECYGLPVMLEKPAGLSVQDANIIATRGPGLTLINHQHLFAEGYERLRQRVSGEGIGAVRAQWKGPGPRRDYSARWDWGAHAVACILGLRDEPFWAPSVREVWVDDGTGAALSFKMGRCTALVDISCNWPEKVARVYFVGGAADWQYDAFAPDAGEPPLTRSVRAFADAVANGGTEDRRFGGRWALDVARVLAGAQSPPLGSS